MGPKGKMAVNVVLIKA